MPKFLSHEHPCLIVDFTDEDGADHFLRFQPEAESGPGVIETSDPAAVAYLTSLADRDANVEVA